MTDKERLIRLLQDTVEGLVRRDYKELGGSDVFRIMSDNENQAVLKLFLDNYDDPSYIIMRFVSRKDEFDE